MQIVEDIGDSSKPNTQIARNIKYETAEMQTMARLNKSWSIMLQTLHQQIHTWNI